MGDNSNIHWTDASWNPVTGCDRVSDGCEHCYALTWAAKLKAQGSPRYQVDGNPRTSGPGFGLTLHPDVLDLPLRWKRPRRVFVNSMSDLFHDDVPDAYIAQVFAVMAQSPRHVFQVLTKRPRRMLSWTQKVARCEHGWLTHNGSNPHAYGGDGIILDTSTVGKDDWQRPLVLPGVWPLPNVWLGVSVEDQRWADQRIPLLLQTSAAVRFISAEPLRGPISLNHYLRCPDCEENGWRGRCDDGLNWVIAGGESGPGHRPMELDWVRIIRNQCVDAGVPFFYKQGAGPRPGMDRELDGRLWEQYPGMTRAKGT